MLPTTPIAHTTKKARIKVLVTDMARNEPNTSYIRSFTSNDACADESRSHSIVPMTHRGSKPRWCLLPVHFAVKERFPAWSCKHVRRGIDRAGSRRADDAETGPSVASLGTDHRGPRFGRLQDIFVLQSGMEWDRVAARTGA